MSAKRGPERVRMSQQLATWLAAQGALSSVARGYLLVGMAAAGIDLTPFASDVQRVLAERIPASLRQLLQAELDGVRPTGGLRASYGWPTEPRRAETVVPAETHTETTETHADSSARDPFDLGIDV